MTRSKHVSTTVRILVALACAGTLSACSATRFTSEPAGAFVRLDRTDGYVGVTPFSMELRDYGFTKRVRCSKDGYKTVELLTNPARAYRVHCVMREHGSPEDSFIKIDWNEPPKKDRKRSAEADQPKQAAKKQLNSPLRRELRTQK